MSDHGERAITVAALKHAVPYLRMFQHKTFVVKAGGAVFADARRTRLLMEQVGLLHQLGIRTVLIHGGGPQSTELAKKLGIEARFVEGRRVTDEHALDIATMVLNGTINTRLLAAARDLGVPAIGMSGVDAGMIRAKRRPPVEVERDVVDYGFVGDIVDVDATALEKTLASGLLPIVSPLSADETGTVLNINADTVAAAIAARLGAEKLILLTGAPGILADGGDPSSLISYIDRRGLAAMREKKQLAAGMLPKADAIDRALKDGVRRVHVISHDAPDSLLLEVFTNEGSGTLVVDDIAALSDAEQDAAR